MSHFDHQTYPTSYNTQPGGDRADGGWLAFGDHRYIKGLLLGAGIVFLATNPKVQRAAIRGAVTLWTTIQGGVEEVKEQVQDIKSELNMSKVEADGLDEPGK